MFLKYVSIISIAEIGPRLEHRFNLKISKYSALHIISNDSTFGVPLNLFPFFAGTCCIKCELKYDIFANSDIL